MGGRAAAGVHCRTPSRSDKVFSFCAVGPRSRWPRVAAEPLKRGRVRRPPSTFRRYAFEASGDLPGRVPQRVSCAWLPSLSRRVRADSLGAREAPSTALTAHYGSALLNFATETQRGLATCPRPRGQDPGPGSPSATSRSASTCLHPRPLRQPVLARGRPPEPALRSPSSVPSGPAGPTHLLGQKRDDLSTDAAETLHDLRLAGSNGRGLGGRGLRGGHLRPGWALGPLGLQPGGRGCDVVRDEQTRVWPLGPVPGTELLEPWGRLSDGVMGVFWFLQGPPRPRLSLLEGWNRESPPGRGEGLATELVTNGQ